MASIAIPSGVLLAALLALPTIFGDFAAYQVGLFLIYGIVAQGIGFIWGKTGILPLGQTLFFGGSAYLTGTILRDVEGLPFQIALLAGTVLLAGLIALVLAAAVFRGRSDSGPYFSLITLALALIAEQLVLTMPELTGGFNGLGGFGPIAGLDPFGSLYYLVAGTAVAVTALLLALNRLPAALIAQALSDNEPRLQLLGYPTHLVKGLAFALSAALAALAGSLFASHQGIVTPTSIGFALSTELVIMTAVGGRFHVLGPLAGAVTLGYLTAELRDSFRYWELLLALLFIGVVLLAPGGFAGLVQSLAARIRKPRPRCLPAPVPAPETRIDRSPAPLAFRDVHLHAGQVNILNGVEFETPDSGIVAIIGPNGAGKTSTFNVISGTLIPQRGKVTLGGLRVDSRPPHLGLRSGIGRKLQVPSVFFSMSVAENLAIATLAGRAGLLDHFRTAPLAWRSRAVERLLSHPSIPLRADLERRVAELAQGHRQLLEFAMTAAAEPRLLMLDEPCAGLSAEETGLMTNLVREYQAEIQGLVIVIEHDMAIVESLSDMVLVLHQGRVLAFGSYAEVKADPAVQAVYAGGTK